MQTLLNELFSFELADFVRPYSYGSEWIIIGEPFRTGIVAPIEWVESPGCSIIEIAPKWAVSIRPEQARLIPGSYWKIVMAEPIGVGGLNSMKDITNRAYGIVTNNDRVADALKTNAKAISILRDQFNVGTVRDANKTQPTHRLVFSDWLDVGMVGRVGIDIGRDLSDEEAQYLRW